MLEQDPSQLDYTLLYISVHQSGRSYFQAFGRRTMDLVNTCCFRRFPYTQRCRRLQQPLVCIFSDYHQARLPNSRQKDQSVSLHPLYSRSLDVQSVSQHRTALGCSRLHVSIPFLPVGKIYITKRILEKDLFATMPPKLGGANGCWQASRYSCLSQPIL